MEPLDDTPDICPVQVGQLRRLDKGTIPHEVHLKAYEVYCELWGPQDALVEGWCRGGFHLSELVAQLYAAAFPREEWEARVREAERGMKLQ